MEYTLLNDLTLSTSIADLEELISNNIPFNFYSPNTEGGLYYYNVSIDLENKIKMMLPVPLRNEAAISLCKILKDVNPHKDHDSKCKINFYIHAGNARTIFFNDPGVPGYSFHGNEKENIYSVRDHKLKKISSFIAHDNEAYLLDTSKIHMVLMPSESSRLIVSVSFDTQYEDVLSILKRNN